VDIDVEAVAWCVRNIADARFLPINPQSHIDAPNGAFDFVFGISVFTHLDQPHEDFWLKELHRIIRPNGLILVSVHGDAAAWLLGRADARIAKNDSVGRIDLGRNADLDSVDVPVGYYRNIYHSANYIYSRWSKEFKVIDIAPASIGNFQDAILLAAKVSAGS
jgi:SAM-dependent methyltransferase